MSARELSKDLREQTFRNISAASAASQHLGNHENMSGVACQTFEGISAKGKSRQVLGNSALPSGEKQEHPVNERDGGNRSSK